MNPREFWNRLHGYGDSLRYIEVEITAFEPRTGDKVKWRMELSEEELIVLADRSREQEGHYKRSRSRFQNDPPPQYTSTGQAWEDLFNNFKYQYPTGGQARPESKSAARETLRKEARIRLAKIAGVGWPTDLVDKVLFRRAQAKAHPDQGGSNDLFREVMDLKPHLVF